MMSDLVAFLRARLDEDELAAKAAPGSEWRSFTEEDVAGASVYDDQWLLLNPVRYDHDRSMSNKPGATGPMYIQRARDELCAHIARHDPARVLREVAAKRAILAQWEAMPPESPVLTFTLCHLAAIYGSHPDYDPAWKP